MKTPWGVPGGVVVGVCMAVATASADMTGSSEGTLAGKKLPAPIAVAAAFSQSGRSLSGTLAVGGDDFAGAYLLHGTATSRTFKASGILNGVSVRWNGKMLGDTMQGRVRLRRPGAKVTGMLSLAKNPPVADGTSCDAVYAANQTLFDDQVLAAALVGCTACHVPGGQADATRFHVSLGDALATARAIVPFVDGANPDASRILAKPLALVPHGGERQILAGSAQDLALRSWVALVAAAACGR